MSIRYKLTDYYGLDNAANHLSDEDIYTRWSERYLRRKEVQAINGSQRLAIKATDSRDAMPWEYHTRVLKWMARREPVQRRLIIRRLPKF